MRFSAVILVSSLVFGCSEPEPEEPTLLGFWQTYLEDGCSVIYGFGNTDFEFYRTCGSSEEGFALETHRGTYSSTSSKIEVDVDAASCPAHHPKDRTLSYELVSNQHLNLEDKGLSLILDRVLLNKSAAIEYGCWNGDVFESGEIQDVDGEDIASDGGVGQDAGLDVVDAGAADGGN